jgi:hypothetical protein
LAPPGCHLFRPRRLWRDQPFRAHSNARRGSRGARPSARRTGGARLGWVPRQGVLT